MEDLGGETEEPARVGRARFGVFHARIILIVETAMSTTFQKAVKRARVKQRDRRHRYLRQQRYWFYRSKWWGRLVLRLLRL